MTINELITALQRFEGTLSVVILADEFQMFHDVQPPREIKLVKGNMLFSDSGENWVEKSDDMWTSDDTEVKITSEKIAVRL